jgi:hypothetical protein
MDERMIERGGLADTDGTEVAVCRGESSLKKIARGISLTGPGWRGNPVFRLQMKRAIYQSRQHGGEEDGDGEMITWNRVMEKATLGKKS